MCLITKNNDPYIAEQDIICYKIYIYINGKYVSPYQKCDMPSINELVTTELQRSGDFYIEKGFHSFACLEDAEVDAEWFGKSNYEGCIARCIIPEGSKYYRGKFGNYISYCSESIKIEKIITFY